MKKPIKFELSIRELEFAVIKCNRAKLVPNLTTDY